MNKEVPDLFDWIRKEVKPVVDDRIFDILDDGMFDDRLRYPFETGGKRFRPGIVFLFGEIVDLEKETYTDIAAGVELIHNYTLVHDDVMDGDEKRRGEPAMWTKYNADTAVNLGNILYTVGLQTMPTETRTLALEKTRRCIEGNQLDLDSEHDNSLTEEEYLEIAHRISGELFELCIEAPQIVANRTFPTGGLSALGPAYTIRDSLLDFNEEKGKGQLGSDIRAGKQTYLVIHADDEDVYDVLEKPFSETTDEDVRRVMEIFRREGSFRAAEQQIDRLVSIANESIEELPECEERRLLHDFSEYVGNVPEVGTVSVNT